jgi:hypothetical protein
VLNSPNPDAKPSPDRDPAGEKSTWAKDKFLYPRARYRGKFTPELLAFNANLQEFAQQVVVLCNLETAGKISPDDTYREIKKQWKALKSSKRNLLVESEPEPPAES